MRPHGLTQPPLLPELAEPLHTVKATFQKHVFQSVRPNLRGLPWSSSMLRDQLAGHFAASHIQIGLNREKLFKARDMQRLARHAMSIQAKGNAEDYVGSARSARWNDSRCSLPNEKIHNGQPREQIGQ
jgi:hypothetical protein